MTDGSALAALLADSGPAGTWVAGAIAGAGLAAPQLALFEAANVLRRQEMSGAIDHTQATLCHADLLVLPVQLWPYPPVAERAWQLRHTLTAYDASYIALAELLGATMITLDRRLAKAPGPRCPVRAFGQAKP
ncbi:MAG: type II toxin-antitoxin system VapC family toxin [Acidimicrobiales bacterium]